MSCIIPEKSSANTKRHAHGHIRRVAVAAAASAAESITHILAGAIAAAQGVLDLIAGMADAAGDVVVEAAGVVAEGVEGAMEAAGDDPALAATAAGAVLGANRAVRRRRAAEERGQEVERVGGEEYSQRPGGFNLLSAVGARITRLTGVLAGNPKP